MVETLKTRKKLIEVALPLEAINLACKADKERKTGHIRNIHKWFAPMPMPALRAMVMATILDAPADAKSAEHLMSLITDLVSTGAEAPPEPILARAKALLSLQLKGKDIWILDPFCGGGSTLVESQRLGLRAEGSDLNPIPLLISEVLTVIAQRRLSQNPGVSGTLEAGFESDVHRYADRIRASVFNAMEADYPNAPNGDPIIYWWWAHTVPSPDPAFRNFATPLVTNWSLSLKKGDEQFLIPLPDKESGVIRFQIGKTGKPPASSKSNCLFSNAPITYEYVRDQASRGNLKVKLLAFSSNGNYGRKFWTPDDVQKAAADLLPPADLPQLEIPPDGLGISVRNYHIDSWCDLFTSRQQKLLSLVARAVASVPGWAVEDGFSQEYGEDLATVLSLSLGKLAQASSRIVRVYVRQGIMPKAEPAFARGDIQLNWDFAETNPFGGSVGDWQQIVTTSLRAFRLIDPRGPIAVVQQSDARKAGSTHSGKYIVVTDPPYFAAIGYADLSEYFYYWIRIALKNIKPSLFATIGVPKQNELIASPKRHGGREKAATYFIDGFTETFRRLASIADPEFPMVIVYAQKQEEQTSDEGASTGWQAMLEAMIRGGLSISGTWPISGTGGSRMRAHGSNSLASYIVFTCRPRPATAPVATRREFLNALRVELPSALASLQQGNTAPVDLAQAAIGPGMAVYTRYERILDADGKALTVRNSLSLINDVLDEVLAEQEGDFDSDTRWAITWFEQVGFDEGDYGTAEMLSKAKNTSVDGMVDAGILSSKSGKVRLLKPEELPSDWDPLHDRRLTVWESVHHLVRALAEGESAAATLVAILGSKSEIARELAYRLFKICERRKRSQEALSYNGLVQSWPEITRLARQDFNQLQTQSALFTEKV